MPLINRIEVANFMNKRRSVPWMPTWPHSVFPLLGLNSVINMPNGSGKTTIVKTVLFILSGMKKRFDEIRNVHFAPRANGHYTHLRVQMTMDTEEGAGLDLFSGMPLGKQMVFGIYGRSGDNEQYHLYSYPGTLEDCPVHREDMGTRGRIELITDKEFEDRLSLMPYKFPSSSRDASKEAWKAYMGKWFDMTGIEEQIAYQLKAGGEGRSTYFEVPSRPNMKYASAVFYEHLAPQLLTDVMGEHGEEDERSIEDTIHEKARQVVHARLRSEEHKQSLERTEKVLRELERVSCAAEEMTEIKSRCQQHRLAIATELSVLKDIIVDNPIPGLPPRFPEEIADVAQYLVLHEGLPYLPDRGFGVFTGDEPKVINQRAFRQNIHPATIDNSQLIDITCDQKISDRDERGRSTKFYDQEKSIALISKTEKFSSDWNRDNAIAAVRSAFEWATTNADTNPARLLKKSLETERSEKKNKQEHLFEELKNLSEEKIRLISEQRQLNEQQAEYIRMHESGLFSRDELTSPETTGKLVAAAAIKAEEILRVHDNHVAKRENVYAAWRSFVEEYGPEGEPCDVLAALVETEQNARLNLETLQSERDDFENKRKVSKEATTAARKKCDALRTRVDEAESTLPQVVRYEEIFPGEEPHGLESKVREDHKKALEERNRIEKEISCLAEKVANIKAFRERFGNGTDPAQWLAKRTELYERAKERYKFLSNELEEAKASLDNLEKFSVAPGQYVRSVANQVGVPFIPLHTAVEDMTLPPERKKQIFTLFSALLFAPVLPDMDMAVTAAQNLATKGMEFPVFVMDELVDFCQTGQITGTGDVARGLFIGVRTRRVDSLLDPTLVETEKDALRITISSQTKRISHLSKAIQRLAHDTPNARLAAMARHALEAKALDLEQHLKVEFESILKEFPRLEERIATEAIDSIRSVLNHRQALAGFTIEKLRLALKESVEALTTAEQDETTTDERIKELNRAIDRSADAVKTASVARSTKEGVLKQVSNFIADKEFGSSFMENAETLRDEFSASLEIARKREKFRFDLAQQFVNTGFNRPSELQKHLEEIDTKIPLLNTDKESVGRDIAALQESIENLGKPIVRIDELAILIIKLYRKPRLIEMPLGIDVSRHELYRTCRFVRGSMSFDESIKRLISLKNEVDQLGEKLAENSSDLKKAETDCKNAENLFYREIDRVTNDATLKMEQQLLVLLQHAKDNPESLKGLVAAAKTNFEKDWSANETARRELDQEWEKMAHWLKEFTRRLPMHLDLMKRVFAPKKDPQTQEFIGAGFVIEGKTISTEDIEAVLQDIVLDIEEYEQDRFLQKEGNLRKEARKNFRKDIRDKFYQRVLLNPSIRVFMPSMSKLPLPLDKEMASSGQSVAMTLLWIVKMADFVGERERAKRTISMRSSAMRKLRRIESQFVFIDGAFSHLSDPSLIDDALAGITQTRGRFQLIVTGHEPEYKNNFKYFPTLLNAREINDRYMYVDNGLPIEPGIRGSHYGAIEIIRTHQISSAKHNGDNVHGPTTS